ncbi:MAG TPA: hypothetical protein PK264_23070, partial [Hyphomicrobiaceae bacterium]|nr:hypothetical protein [Hyphomicrobiaceae bacterium]
MTRTTYGATTGYRALTSVSATKTGAPLDQTPQSVAVVPRAVIDDTAPLSVGEALKNVSAVSSG